MTACGSSVRPPRSITRPSESFAAVWPTLARFIEIASPIRATRFDFISMITAVFIDSSAPFTSRTPPATRTRLSPSRVAV